MIKEVILDTDTIKLDQFLKWVAIVSSGAEAKFLISERKIKVNGVIETRRGKQLKIGDIIEFAGSSFQIVPPRE